MTTSDVGAVVIGRNEGARLVACLASLRGVVRRIVYVDSGSTDGSVAAARAAGADVVLLDRGRPFTAARARNAGLAAFGPEPPAYVQFVDGDCVLRDGWIETARAFLDAHPRAGIVCGRRREREPAASVYNRLCDREWDTPIGPARACGGDMLARTSALGDVRGFRDDLIAGEEPELCVRLRSEGWTIWRIDAEMTLHDAALTRFAQWWRRSRRAGFAFAQGAWLHGAPPERHWTTETRRALAWGAALPVAALIGAVASPAALLALLAYPAQVVRLALRAGPRRRTSWEWAFFTTLGKLPEALGALAFQRRRVFGRRADLIEYK
ncbi:glycosyltransferase [Salinarimonas sp.]|uniref:glycosyltransferase n=1 Tax=Salinarimonas sp. TaxID=2766526 RepID=UPI0032D94554